MTDDEVRAFVADARGEILAGSQVDAADLVELLAILTEITVELAAT